MTNLSADYMVDKLSDIVLNELWEWSQFDGYESHNIQTEVKDGMGRIIIEVKELP